MTRTTPGVLTALVCLLGAGCGPSVEDALRSAGDPDAILSEAELETLAAHADSDEVQETLLARASGYWYTPLDAEAATGELEVIDAVLSAHPRPSFFTADAAISVIARYGFVRARTWGEGYGEEDPSLAIEVRKRLEEAIHRDPSEAGEVIDRLFDELAFLGGKVDHGLVALALGAWMGTESSRARSLVENGMPAMYRPLGDEKLALGPDGEHLRAGLGLYLDTLAKRGGPRSDYVWKRLLEAVRRWTPPETPQTLDALIALHSETSDSRVGEIVRLVSKDPESWVRRRAGALGAKADLEGAEKLLAASGTQASTKEELAEVPRQKLDPESEREMSRGLFGEDDDMAKLSVNAWMQVDSTRLAEILNERLEKGESLNDAGVAEAFNLLRKEPGSAVDEFYMRSLGGFGELRAAQATAVLRDRLDAEAFVTALFGFMERKPSFSKLAVEGYKKALRAYPDMETHVAGILGRYLDAAKGNPARVFWMVKVLSIDLLAERGKSTAIPVLERLKSDGSTYSWETWKTDPSTGERIEGERVERVHRFSEEAAKAIRTIEQREEAKR